MAIVHSTYYILPFYHTVVEKFTRKGKENNNLKKQRVIKKKKTFLTENICHYVMLTLLQMLPLQRYLHVNRIDSY
jgi:hypothetical protein